jgi:hypothetical protein
MNKESDINRRITNLELLWVLFMTAKLPNFMDAHPETV